MPIELLAPAQDWKALRATVPYAHAVYFGMDQFNMRMRAGNFRTRDLPAVAEFCHGHDLRAYLATNVILYDAELPPVAELISAARDAGIDAVIVQDCGAIQICREVGIPFHVSTQASISNLRAAQFYEDLGAARLILARELSLVQIAEIKANLVAAEVECFVHGAQCTSISGRCYFSTDVCGSPENSANRGLCIQPCRRRWTVTDEEGNAFDYDGQYFLNAKDVCMIEYIPALVAAGIDAFKIEGRMREADYVEVVTRCYREALDAQAAGTYTAEKVAGWLAQLQQAFNRGFSTGFYFHRPTDRDISKVRGNAAPIHREEIGHVLSYFPSTGAAKIQVTHGQLTVGDEITVEGFNTDTHFKQVVGTIQFGPNEVDHTPLVQSPGQKVVVEVALVQPVVKNDRIYKYVPRSVTLPPY